MGRAPYLLIGPPDWVSLSAFAAGLDLVGRSCIWGRHGSIDLKALRPAAIVIDGMRGGGLHAVRQAARQGITAIVLDHGFLKRVQTSADYFSGHWYVGLGGLGWSPPRAPDRERFASLGLAIRTRPERIDGPALIMAQIPGDASHGLNQPRLQAAYERIAGELRAAGIQRIAYRPHPNGWTMGPAGCEQWEPASSSLADAIDRARFVVTLNSNSGLDAIMAGVPAVTLLPSHYQRLAWRWPVIPALIAPPHPAEVEEHCCRLAWAQWTLAEIRAGAPQRWLINEGYAP